MDLDEARLCRLYRYFLTEYEERQERPGTDPAFFVSNIIQLVCEVGVGYNGDMCVADRSTSYYLEDAETFTKEYADEAVRRNRASRYGYNDVEYDSFE